MARFSDKLIEQLKTEVSLVRLMQSQGFELKKHGKDYLCRCPFHDDKTPSLVVTPSNNLWNCLGACGEGGSVIDWVMKREGISFRRAVEILQHDLGLISESHQPVKKSTTKQLPSSLSEIKDEQQALKRVIYFYHETLKQSPEAIEYLESRGLNHPELINTFKLGFANRTLAYRLPEKNRKAGAEIRGRLQSIGILRKTGHEHFNGCLVVPIIDNEQDETGDIQEVYGRKINGNRLRKGTAQHLYLPGEHRGIWNQQALASADEIILCESLIDAMTFWVNGFRNVTTSYGVNGFTEELLNAFINHSIKRVLIAYDRDEAGNIAAQKLSEQLKKHEIDCYRILFPKKMDANEYALQMTPSDKALGLVIRKAEPMLTAKPRATKEMVLEKNAAKEQPQKQPSSLAADLPEPDAAAEPKTPIDIEADINEREIKLRFGNRNYRVRGLQKNQVYDQLRINLLVSKDETLHVDTLELYNAKQRQTFIKLAASELSCEPNIIKKDLGKILLKLEALQDEQIEKNNSPVEKVIELSPEQKDEALELLKDKYLLRRIIKDFHQCGIVGEETNLLMGYLAAVSRKLDKPLAIIIQSTSAAGKSSLMDAVLAMFPPEERVQYSAMTGQSLFYMGETRLKHKILAISEEEGVEQASYALKLLQSEGEVTIASTGKNATTGNLETQEYHVEGPVMLFLTTTAIDIDEELLNRCLVLTVNESGEQTAAIQQSQRTSQTLEGLLINEHTKHTISLHQNAQRLLKPLKVVNPFAEQLTFRSDQTRTRRDHMKYLTLIQSVTYLHQYQREIKPLTQNGQPIHYIEVTLEDIQTANQLAHEVLGRTLDELPPQTRKMLMELKSMITNICQAQKIEQSDYRFSRRDLREQLGWSYDQVRVHLDRLVKLEYVLSHHGKRGQSFVYELLYDGNGEEGETFLMGLIDSDELKKNIGTTKSLGGENPHNGVGLGGHWGTDGVAVVTSETKPQPNNHNGNGDLLSSLAQNEQPTTQKNTPSYLNALSFTGQ